MDLRAFGGLVKSTAQREAEAARNTAQKAAANANGDLLFKNKAAPLQAAIVAKAAGTVPAGNLVQPVANSGQTVGSDVIAVVRGFTQAIDALRASIVPKTTAVKASAVPVAPPATPASLARRSSGNPPIVPMRTPGQLRREEEAREASRKAAARSEADRALVLKGGGKARVLALRTLADVPLSDAATLVLDYVTQAWQANAKRPVQVQAAAVARSVGLSAVMVETGFTELKGQAPRDRAQRQSGGLAGSNLPCTSPRRPKGGGHGGRNLDRGGAASSSAAPTCSADLRARHPEDLQGAVA